MAAPVQAEEPEQADEPAPAGRDHGPARAALLAGLTTLIAALTAVATVNGEIGRMFRNDNFATTVALGLILIAILCGLLTQAGTWPPNSLLLVVGSCALVLGMAFALHAEVGALSMNDRPTIAMTVTENNASAVDVHAQVTGRKAKAHDQIVVIVYGVADDGARTPPIYYAKSGPDTEGNLIQDLHLAVDSVKYSGVYVSAVEVPESILPPNVDCDGFLVGPDGQTTTTTNPDGTWGALSFRPDDHDPLVSCATVEFPAHHEVVSTSVP